MQAAPALTTNCEDLRERTESQKVRCIARIPEHGRQASIVSLAGNGPWSDKNECRAKNTQIQNAACEVLGERTKSTKHNAWKGNLNTAAQASRVKSPNCHCHCHLLQCNSTINGEAEAPLTKSATVPLSGAGPLGKKSNAGWGTCCFLSAPTVAGNSFIIV